MTEWVSLLQSLVWPIFIAIILVATRNQITAILKSISTRIEQGDPFQAGPSGISLGKGELKLTRLEEKPDTKGETEKSLPTSDGNIKPKNADEPEEDVIKQYGQVTYLIHSVSAPREDIDGMKRRGILVVVDADSNDILDNIERVIYHLHPTFPQPDRETKDRKRCFELKTRAWGEFNLSADIYFKGYKKPLKVCRYLNFQNF